MKKRVLFLCTGNSCRSQMAEGILRKLGNDYYDVFSAGTKPSVVNPLAIKAMNELNIDISHHRSKSMDEFKDQHVDFVITVCGRANESCPIFPNDTKRIHWSFDDPAEAKGSEEERMIVFRRVRQEIERRIQLFVTSQQAKTR